MKYLALLALSALILLPASWAAAGSTKVIIGGEDGLTSAAVLLAEEKVINYLITAEKITTPTGPGYSFKLVKEPHTATCLGAAKKAPAGHWAKFYLGGPNNYDEVVVQMSRHNHFNTTHSLLFTWETPHCYAEVDIAPGK